MGAPSMHLGLGLILAAALVALVHGPTAAAHADLTPSSILARAKELSSWIVELRRDLHAIPEKGYEEKETGKYLREVIRSLNLTYKYPYGKTGVVAYHGLGAPLIGLRADMDGLPINEVANVPYKSRHPGWMHACGHDAHMAMLLGAAKILSEVPEGDLGGSVAFMFQPNEEFGAGAKKVIHAGMLQDVTAVFGMHVMPLLPSGKLATRVGYIMAGALSFEITVYGKGGHAAIPHLNRDPIPAAAAIVSSLQTLVSREVGPLENAVLSVTKISAGESFNVIPDTATVGGTIRALSDVVMQRLKSRVEGMVPHIAAGFNLSARVDWRLDTQPYYPPVKNDVYTTHYTYQIGQAIFGEDGVVDTEPMLIGEDFAFYCQAVPCTFAFLGIRNETAGSVHNLHSPDFTMDENVLHLGAAMHATWAMEMIKRFKADPHQQRPYQTPEWTDEEIDELTAGDRAFQSLREEQASSSVDLDDEYGDPDEVDEAPAPPKSDKTEL